MKYSWRERLWFWFEQHIVFWLCDPIGRIRRRWWYYRQCRRYKDPEYIELSAFRSLIDIEQKLEMWPRAIPLLESAVVCYDVTNQPSKREAMRLRLAAVDPKNPKVMEYFEKERRLAREAIVAKIAKMNDAQKHALDQARALVKESGRCSIAMLQRRMGISYNHAAELFSILHTEAPSSL